MNERDETMETPQIDGMQLKYLAYEPLNHLISRIVAVLLAEGSPEKALGEALEADRNAFEALIRPQKSDLGVTLSEIDRHVDHFWRGTRSQLKLSLENPNEGVRAAAEKIWAVFEATPDQTRAKYEVEYGALSALLLKLAAFDEEILEKAYVNHWIQALRDGFNAFKQKQDQKSEAKLETELGQARKARDQMLDRYNAIVARINAIMVLSPDEAHAALVSQINQRIEEHRQSEKAGRRAPKETPA